MYCICCSVSTDHTGVASHGINGASSRQIAALKERPIRISHFTSIVPMKQRQHAGLIITVAAFAASSSNINISALDSLSPEKSNLSLSENFTPAVVYFLIGSRLTVGSEPEFG